MTYQVVVNTSNIYRSVRQPLIRVPTLNYITVSPEMWLVVLVSALAGVAVALPGLAVLGRQGCPLLIPNIVRCHPGSTAH